METRMLYNPRPVLTRTFPNTEKATFEVAKRFIEAILFTTLLGQYYPMTNTQWLKNLRNLPSKPRIVSEH
jgi:hypothetical protein